MKLEIVNFEQAIALNELGFYSDPLNERELYVTSNEVTWVQEIEIPYSDGYERIIHHETFPVNVVGEILYDVRNKNSCISRKFQTVYAPTLELAAKWLRKEKQLFLTVQIDLKTHLMAWNIINLSTDIEMVEPTCKHNSYEEALSAGIDKAIEILKGI